MRSVVLPLTLFCWLTSTVVGAAPGGVIRGKVRASSGEALSQALVELWRNGIKAAQTVTTAEGDFSFAGLAPANYKIIAQHDSYQTAVQIVALQITRDSKGGHPAQGGKPERRTNIVSVEITLKPSPLLPATLTHHLIFKPDAPFGARLAYEEALLRFKSQKTDEAIRKLKEAVTLFPDYFDAQFTLAVELSKLNQTEASIAALEQARRINDRDERVYRLFGMLMAQERKFAVAEYAFRQAIQRDASQAESYFFHAITLIEIAIAEKDAALRQANFDTAERELQKALELSGKKMAKVYLQLARVYEYRGQRPAAANALETYLKLQPDDKNVTAIRAAIARLRQ
jgi:Tfp pilus assembly protein PilF